MQNNRYRLVLCRLDLACHIGVIRRWSSVTVCLSARKLIAAVCLRLDCIVIPLCDRDFSIFYGCALAVLNIKLICVSLLFFKLDRLCSVGRRLKSRILISHITVRLGCHHKGLACFHRIAAVCLRRNRTPVLFNRNDCPVHLSLRYLINSLKADLIHFFLRCKGNNKRLLCQRLYCSVVNRTILRRRVKKL